mgnify:CR=1 FL=1
MSVVSASDFLYSTGGISINIQKQPFQIAYSFKGKPIMSEKAGYVKNDSLETIQFNLTKDEVRNRTTKYLQLVMAFQQTHERTERAITMRLNAKYFGIK